MSNTDRLTLLVERHEQLDRDLARSGRRLFVSNWDGACPAVAALLPELINAGREVTTHRQYIFEDQDLVNSILSFHRQLDGLTLRSENVLLGDGSTPLLSAIGLALRNLHITSASVIPPVYHMFQYMLSSFGIKLTLIEKRHAFESEFRLSLPSSRSVLVITDPLWYAGVRVPSDVIAEIGAWQQRTQSLVIVDGTFQYLPWDGVRSESTASLVDELTIRLVCPTKYLGMHGVRFAYTLVPERLRSPLIFAYEAIVGASSAWSRSIAHHVVRLMHDDVTYHRLRRYFRDQYQELVASGAFTPVIEPNCGYFAFGHLAAPPERIIGMGGEYFEQFSYPGAMRINLALVPEILSVLHEPSADTDAATISKNHAK